MECCSTKNDEGCCKDLNLNEKMKGGKRFQMDRRIFLWAVIGILALAVVYVVFFMAPSSVNQVVTATQTAGQSAAATTSASYGGMVGGC